MLKTSKRLEIFAKAFRAVSDNPSPALALPSFAGSSAAFAAASLALDVRAVPFVLAVTPGLPEADTLYEDLRVLERESPVRVLELPPVLEDDRSSTAARLKVAAALGAYSIRPYPLVVAAPMPALLDGVPAAAAVTAATMRLSPGAEGPQPSFSSVQSHLAAAGYERTAEVTEEGQFSVRGGVLDVWPPGADRPVRSEFFGDELESLRSFDPVTQISVGGVSAVELPPVEIAAEMRSVLDVLPDGCTVLWLEHNACAEGVRDVPNAARRIFTGDPAPRGVPTGSFAAAPLPGFAEMRAPAGAVDPSLAEAVRARLAAHVTAANRRGALTVHDDELSGGFEVPGLVVVAKSDRVLSARRPAARSRIRTGARLSETFDLEPGELVVHLDYGVGRFLGSTEVDVNGARSEVFTVEYAGGAKLHVPVAHAHLLSRYVGVKGVQVKLHSLEGGRWRREKASAQRAVQDLAASLLETQARRAIAPGFAYDIAAEGTAEFEAAFPFEETPDQTRAIADVMADLSSTRPMDRLVCGDAGYGKTEVAMRAAFIAAMNGKQTALLAPTTVLAEQHYESFLARFEGTPVRIETLSRFVSNEAKRGIRARLLSGATDIIIGTHAILSSKIAFHDLGLIVIDEEQRFGVRQKEHLKRLRATADVLTLSATPIPRTLYLSMTGARDLSILRTPPRERVAVASSVVRDSDSTVQNAIRRELARGGQVYFLHNRVLTIDGVAKRIHALVPEARLDVAHGQMPAQALAEKMQAFAKGKTDVLVCTTIVESGLDIPRANTILIDRADHLGLAELYQLRGRVGRGSRQGYAFFLLPADGLIEAEARERLDALMKHGGLGVGFNLAMRDLEIRGAGNLLGSEQSGHIAAVGFQLYCQLLQRTISRLKGEDLPPVVNVSISLDFLDFSPGGADADACGACLPYDYVEEEAQRMDFHKRLAETSSIPSVKKLRAELADRYGRLPSAALRLLKLAELRIVCAQNGISGVSARNSLAVFRRADNGDVAFTGKITGSTPEKKIASLFRMIASHQPRKSVSRN